MRSIIFALCLVSVASFAAEKRVTREYTKEEIKQIREEAKEMRQRKEDRMRKFKNLNF